MKKAPTSRRSRSASFTRFERFQRFTNRRLPISFYRRSRSFLGGLPLTLYYRPAIIDPADPGPVSDPATASTWSQGADGSDRSLPCINCPKTSAAF
jgi:hypothetical protein